jgi:dUTP pyrophosphatase
MQSQHDVLLKIGLDPQLKISTPELFYHLADIYKTAIQKHNEKYINSEYMDAGFDLFLPKNIASTISISKFYTLDKTQLIDFHIQCEAIYRVKNSQGDIIQQFPTGFYLYPRSSIYKLPIRLANSVGIIDAGYRGNIKAALDFFLIDSVNMPIVYSDTRFLQICAPNLSPLFIEWVDDTTTLSTTQRGSKGFGSSGSTI